MARYPMPDHEGYFWAKLVNPRDGTSKPEHFGQTDEDLKSEDWEVVHLYHNPNADDPDERWVVAVPGIELFQFALDFVWGPEVIRPAF